MVWAVFLLLSELRAETVPAPTRLENCGRKLSDVVYKTVEEQRLLLDIYYPSKEPSGRAPVFYYTHGGGWYVGSKDLNETQETLFSRLLQAGVVCVSINYRLVSSSTPEHPVQMRDCVTDSKDGLRFLKKNEEKFALDMTRVVTFGTSAGGQISLIDAYSKPDDFIGDPGLSDFQVLPVGCVSWSGPTDFTVSDLFVPSGFEGNLKPDRFTSRIRTGAPKIGYHQAGEPLKAMMREVSPVTYLTEHSPPVLQIHGDRDGTIPHKHALHLQKMAARVGAAVHVITVKSAGHSFQAGNAQVPNIENIIRATVDFTLQRMTARLQPTL